MDQRRLQGQQEERHDRRLLHVMMSPSWLSGFIGFALAIALIGFMLFEGRYQGSELQQQLLDWQSVADDKSVNSAFHALRHSTENIAATAQVFVFWLAVGTAAYLIFSAVYLAISSANETRQHLYFVNMSRHEYLRSIYKRLAFRTIVLAAWAGYSILTLKVLLPYLLGAIHIGDVHLPTIGGVGLLLGAGLGVVATYHLHVVFLRLLLARPRVFHSDEYAAIL